METNNRLIEMIENSKREGSNYLKVKRLNSQKADIVNFSSHFDIVYMDFIKIEESLKLMYKIINEKIDLEPTKSSLILLKEKFNKDDYDMAYLNTLKREIALINLKILELWNNYIGQKTAAISGVLETINTIIAELPERTILYQKKTLFSRAAPGSQEAINAIDEYTKLASSLIAKLDLKDSVLNFLKLIATGKNLTLKDLNAEVYDWLQANGFSSKINVSFTSNERR
ncbi:MAG: hypothetical protein WCL51_01330 [Bacteroidota bacterium]